MILTIAIPTYNRPEKLKNTVLDLIPQLNDHTKVMILDNHSPVDVKEYLTEHFGRESIKGIEVIRHKVNIGPDANFARCFEYCDTPYIWTLGDDDKVEPNAVQLILAEIQNYHEEDLIGINFNSNCCHTPRKNAVIISSTNDFVNKVDDFGNLLFLSTAVYKTSEYLKYIRYAIWGAYTMSSQIIPAMMAVSNGKTFILSDKYIVTNIPEQDHEKGWSPVQLALALSAILETPVGFKNDEYRIFGKKIAEHFNCLYPGDAMLIMVKSVNGDIDKLDNYHIYLFKQVIMKTFEFRTRKFKQLVQYYIALFLLHNKSLLKLAFKLFKLEKRIVKLAPYALFKRN